MSYRALVLSLFFCFVYYALASDMNSRQKRCIVVQKQSGTHGDSSEGDGGDGEERQPEPRESKPDRRRVLDPLDNVRKDVEEIPPNLLKYRIPLTKRYPNDWRRYVSRIFKNVS